MSGIADITQWVVHAIERTPVRERPWPHIYVENVWPTDFYDQMLDHMPSDKVFKVLSTFGTVAVGTYKERFCFPLNENWIRHEYGVGGEVGDTWRTARAVLGDPRVWGALRDHFHMKVTERFPVGSSDYTLRLRLMSDRAGYKIGPHIDAPKRIVSALFYMADGTERPEIGTRLYSPTNALRPYEHGIHNKFEEFVEVGRARFLPNTMLGMFNGEDTFHGVPPIEVPLDYRRNILLYDLNEVPVQSKSPPPPTPDVGAGYADRERIAGTEPVEPALTTKKGTQ